MAKVKIGLRCPRSEMADEECGDAIDMMSVQAPYPTAEGLVLPIDFPHVMQACNAEVKLSWKRLAPYLSDEGRAMMASWLQSGR